MTVIAALLFSVAMTNTVLLDFDSVSGDVLVVK